jgi:DNA-binding NarL/FixJ family response regulator
VRAVSVPGAPVIQDRPLTPFERIHARAVARALEIESMAKRGLTSPEIAVELRVTARSMASRLARASKILGRAIVPPLAAKGRRQIGAKPRAPGAPSYRESVEAQRRRNAEEIAALADEGLTLDEIASRLGLPKCGVTSRLRAARELLGRPIYVGSEPPEDETPAADAGALTRCKTCGLLEPHECYSTRVEDYARRSWNPCTDGG